MLTTQTNACRLTDGRGRVPQTLAEEVSHNLQKRLLARFREEDRDKGRWGTHIQWSVCRKNSGTKNVGVNDHMGRVQIVHRYER